MAVPHVGLAGQPDHEIWNYALEHDFAVVTINARDFIRLLDVEIHPGPIVVREGGLTREEQWAHILPLIEHIKKSGGGDFLVNKLVEVLAPGRCAISGNWHAIGLPTPRSRHRLGAQAEPCLLGTPSPATGRLFTREAPYRPLFATHSG